MNDGSTMHIGTGWEGPWKKTFDNFTGITPTGRPGALPPWAPKPKPQPMKVIGRNDAVNKLWGGNGLGGVTRMPNMLTTPINYGGMKNGADPEDRIFGASNAEREIANAKPQSMYGGPWAHGGKTLAGGSGPSAVGSSAPMQPMQKQPQQRIPNESGTRQATPQEIASVFGKGGAYPPIAGKREDGGEMEEDRMYIVGEEGEELVIPRENGEHFVIPADITKRILKGDLDPEERADGGVMQPLPQFSPEAQALLRQPPGMRKTDWKRFLAKGGGMELMQMDQDQQRWDQRMQMEEGRYQRDRADQLSDREAMKAEKAAMERDEDARSMEMIQALGSDQAILSPADVATLGRIKGAKARGAALDVLMQRRAAEREQENDSIERAELLPAGDGFVPVVRTKGGQVKQSSFVPNREKAAVPVPAGMVPTRMTANGVTYEDPSQRKQAGTPAITESGDLRTVPPGYQMPEGWTALQPAAPAAAGSPAQPAAAVPTPAARASRLKQTFGGAPK